MEQEPFLTIHEAGQRVALGPGAIRRAIQRGDLPAIKLCSRVRIEPAELDRWVARHRVRSDSRVGP